MFYDGWRWGLVLQRCLVRSSGVLSREWVAGGGRGTFPPLNRRSARELRRIGLILDHTSTPHLASRSSGSEVVAGHPVARVAQGKLEQNSPQKLRKKPQKPLPRTSHLQTPSTAAVEMTDYNPKAAQDKQV